jgi:hypothetical protein
MIKLLLKLFRFKTVNDKRYALKDRLNGCVNFKRIEEEQ